MKNIPYYQTIINHLNTEIADIQKSLNHAVNHSNLETVKGLVQAGADVTYNHSQDLQRAAIIKSAEFGNLDIISYLVEQGADVETIRNTKHPIVSQWVKDNYPLQNGLKHKP